MTATIILICLLFGKFIIHGSNHGEAMNTKYNVLHSIAYISLQLVLYYFAGLFDKF